MATPAKEMRAVYAETLVELGAKNKDIVLLEADLMKASGTGPFQAAYPERTFDVGVAEANMVGVAAGLSAEGKIPFAATFGCFATRRVFDQFFVSCAYARLNVKLVGTDPGVSAAMNGGTHMPFEDLALMRAVPGIAVLEPSDAASLRGLVAAAAERKGSVYMRLHRKAVPDLYPAGEKFEIGKAKLLREGKHVAIVALGSIMVNEALKAAELLAKEGIEASVVDALSVKPLDAELVLREARKCGAVVTAENHQASGGLGSAVAELLAETGAARLARIGVKDEFGEVGTQDYLQDRFGLRAANIAEAAKALAKA
ncbi:MAG TPA: transketolase C-terminal domain-containing protein [Spirochaetales bacterium]|nr:transketolase C-terminal domain-containing protein [Spirochaetales bacterium]